MYRGIGNNVAERGRRCFFSTDPTRAAAFGQLHYVDVTADEMAKFERPHSERILRAEPIAVNDWRTADPEIIARLKPLDDADQLAARVQWVIDNFGPTLVAEKLAEHHGCSVARETLRGWMIADGLWRDRRHRLPPPHQPRRRRDCLGELVQIDGSEHAWFEDRGAPCTLLGFVDDATSRLMQLRFVTSESAFDYFRTTRAYVEEHGKPVAFYSDKHGIFRVNSKEAAGGDGVTQFGRALLALNIDIICANSPQAKGRIERAFGTLQDRMVKELRLAGVSSIAAANAWLPEFITAYNTRFGRDPANAKDLHRPLAQPMIWTRSWPGGRSARSRAT
jgi:hypothetical protein